jgi:hypothetical protein
MWGYEVTAANMFAAVTMPKKKYFILVLCVSKVHEFAVIRKI